MPGSRPLPPGHAAKFAIHEQALTEVRACSGGRTASATPAWAARADGSALGLGATGAERSARAAEVHADANPVAVGERSQVGQCDRVVVAGADVPHEGGHGVD